MFVIKQTIMNKDNKDNKNNTPYEFRSGEYNKRKYKTITPSKLKCGRIGIDCLIKN